MSNVLRSRISIIVLCLLPLIPIWYFDYLPLQDYPNHFARLTILSSYEHSDFYRENFRIEFFKGILPLPYITLDVVVHRFLSFLDIDKAMRVFISLYIGLYILSLYLLAAHLKKDFELLMLINLPIIYSWFFYLGFLDFIFSVPMFLFSVWAVERYEMHKDKLSIFLTGFLLILIYLTHIFTFFIFCIFLICYLSTKMLNIRKYIYLLAAVSLFLLLTIKLGLLGIPKTPINPPLEKLLGIFFIFFHLPNYFFIISSILFAFAIYIILRNSSFQNKLYLISSGAFLVVYIVLPRVADTVYVFMDARALLFSFLLLPFSLQIKNNMYVKLAKVMLIAVFFVSFSWLLTSFSNFNKNFSTKCAGQIENRSIIFPIDAVQSEEIIKQYLHSWGYFLKSRELLTPYLFEHAHVPIKYKHKPSAPSESWVLQGNMKEGKEFINTIRGTYDYILLIGNDSKVKEMINTISYETCSEGLVSLYKVEKDRK